MLVALVFWPFGITFHFKMCCTGMNQNLDLYTRGDSWEVGPGHTVIDTLLYHKCTNVRRQFDCPAMFYYYLKLPIKVKKTF